MILVVQILPGPIPTLIASAPASARSLAPLAVELATMLEEAAKSVQISAFSKDLPRRPSY